MREAIPCGASVAQLQGTRPLVAEAAGQASHRFVLRVGLVKGA